MVVHHNVALMLCESPAVLEEILVELDLSEFVHQRIGPRAIVAPAPVLEQLRDELRERGVYPRVIGQPVDPHTPDEDEEE